MSKFIVDVEADGPCPGLHSMVSFGCVKFEKRGNLSTDFYSHIIRPISNIWVPSALAISKITRDEHEASLNSPVDVMLRFRNWLKEHNTKGSPVFFSDNNGFDWQFINYYFHVFSDDNPFGFSSQNIGSLYKGQMRNMSKNFKHLRKTKHSHHPVDDARGNAEAMQSMGWFDE
jgi:3' exoribonuclease, RNase T-like